ncbi:FK506-binding protein 5-like [Mercenaria mercenaria]|uniref:FK506-binding protein 5-like n=1 Tax=Mercenaria mercenaria TaxID=6596 RepID=UPI00234F834E|nr:FK506-binding protein 5-like [Mercenaria mercenaria]
MWVYWLESTTKSDHWWLDVGLLARASTTKSGHWWLDVGLLARESTMKSGHWWLGVGLLAREFITKSGHWWLDVGLLARKSTTISGHRWLDVGLLAGESTTKSGHWWLDVGLLTRESTCTPWCLIIGISRVNPKSLSHRLGLRVGDRLLAIGSVQAHNMSHEQAKMEIIRAGNELDLIVQRSASAVIDQPDSRQAYRSQPQRTELVEEPTEYRGYTNPNVQSRSFKILQESLSYSEANEEGIVLPTGNTPGEGIVRKAYSEGRRRLEELSEINPRNFTEEGQSPYRVSEHYNTRDESVISEPKQSGEYDPTVTVVAAKVYDGSEPRQRKRPTVNIAQSSVLSPAAGQQQYLQQAHEHYQTKLESRPTVNIAQSSVLSPAAGQQQYLHQAQEHYQTKLESRPQHQTRPAQHAVVHQQKPQEKPLKLVNYQFDEQYSHLRREPSSVQTQQHTQIVQTNRQKAVVSPQKSNDFIPATETVSSVAADLDLKIVAPGVAPQQTIEVKQVSRPAERQVVKQVVQTVRLAEQTTKPTAQVTKPAQQVAKPVEPTIKVAEQVAQPTEPIVKPAQQVAKPEEQTIKPKEEVAKPVEPTVKPAEQVAKPEEQIDKPVEQDVTQTVQTVVSAEEIVKPEKQIIKPPEDTGKVMHENPIQTAEVQSETPETNKQIETVEAQTDETVNKFAEQFSASVVASAQQSLQTTLETEKNTSTNVDGCMVSKESPAQSVEEKVDVHTEQESQPVSEQVQQKEVTEVESKPAEEELGKLPVGTEDSVVTHESTVDIEGSKSGHDKPSETIPIAVVEELKEEKEVIEEPLTPISERERRPSLQVPETDTEINVSLHNTDEQVSVTVEEGKEESVETESKSAEVEQTTQIETVISSDQNVVQSNDQTINIATDAQAEEQSFTISVDQTEETSETVDLTVDTNEMVSESSVAFEISTDADVSMDVSSDINVTTVSTDVITDANAESDAAVTLSLEPAAKESDSTEFTISVTEEVENDTTEVSKPVKEPEPKQNGQNNSKPTRAKFVDSQGGVAARLARFKQK